MSISARRVETFGTTIFTEINELAAQHNALNLGQGKPDFDTPPDIVQQAILALQSGKYSQYSPGPGTSAFRQAVANHAARFYALEIDPARGVLATVGATEGIFAAILGLVDPGDEVIVIEPVYDSYVPNILMAGATPVYVPLHPPTWTFDPAELAAAFTNKTRALILNSPHNPTGRVFTRTELELIAQLCIEHDATVISDEVYEHLTFGAAQYISIATLPGMFERTVSVSSVGKSFNATGWKVGWVYGHPDLVDGVKRAHQFIAFCVHHPSQDAVAYALNLPDEYYISFRKMYTAKLQLLTEALDHTGLQYRIPEGTYFLMTDFSAIFKGSPIEFTHYLIKEIGVACIPPETFYSPEHVHFGSTYVRFAFCKSDELLMQAKELLARLTD
jgi:N-succinyldiaminopimelate aminotransferase